MSLPSSRLGSVVWTRQTLFSVDGRYFDQYEEYRLVRVTADEVGGLVIDTTEARYGHHWWSLVELATTTETVGPKGMAALLPAVLAGKAANLHLGDFNEDQDS